MSQPIKNYKILIETHPSYLDGQGFRTLRFTGTKQEAQAHLTEYLTSRRMSGYKAYLQEVL
jgi:hypothetical protein